MPVQARCSFAVHCCPLCRPAGAGEPPEPHVGAGSVILGCTCISVPWPAFRHQKRVGRCWWAVQERTSSHSDGEPATCAARRTQLGHLQLQKRSNKLCCMTPIRLQASEAHRTVAVGVKPADSCPGSGLSSLEIMWSACRHQEQDELLLVANMKLP